MRWLPLCTSLTNLYLGENAITDEGLTTLTGAVAQREVMPNLKGLYLHKNRFTAEGAGKLIRALESGALPALNELTLLVKGLSTTREGLTVR